MSYGAQWHSLRDHLTQLLQECPLCGCVCPPIVVEPCLLLTCQWVELTHRLTDYEYWPQPQHTNCCAGADPTEWDFAPVGSGAYQNHILGMLFVELIGWCSVVV